MLCPKGLRSCHRKEKGGGVPPYIVETVGLVGDMRNSVEVQALCALCLLFVSTNTSFNWKLPLVVIFRF